MQPLLFLFSRPRLLGTPPRVLKKQLTLSAAEASQAKKNSSLYKSAGGALSSILNQFVDESYYRSDAAGSSGEGREALRCGVAALGNAIRGEECSLRALGLGRTGITNRDASKLAAALRARRVNSPLEEVEVKNKLKINESEEGRLFHRLFRAFHFGFAQNTISVSELWTRWGSCWPGTYTKMVHKFFCHRPLRGQNKTTELYSTSTFSPTKKNNHLFRQKLRNLLCEAERERIQVPQFLPGFWNNLSFRPKNH